MSKKRRKGRETWAGALAQALCWNCAMYVCNTTSGPVWLGGKLEKWFWEVRNFLERMEVGLWILCQELGSTGEWDSLETLHGAMATWMMTLGRSEETGKMLGRMGSRWKMIGSTDSLLLRICSPLHRKDLRAGSCSLICAQVFLVYPMAFASFLPANKYLSVLVAGMCVVLEMGWSCFKSFISITFLCSYGGEVAEGPWARTAMPGKPAEGVWELLSFTDRRK